MRSSRLLQALLLVSLLLAGIWLGGHPSLLPGFVRGVLVDDSVAGSSDARLVDEALDIMEKHYYRPVDRKALVDEGLKASVKSLDDRFSAYFDPKTFHHFEEASSGGFEGVGMTVEANKRGVEVQQTFPGSPARRAGLKAGDIIVAADGKSLKGKPTDAATALIKGKAGTTVLLRVRRADDVRELRVRRERVEVSPVVSKIVRQGAVPTGHVRLASFTRGSGDDVDAAVRRVLDKGAEAVVLDLRANGGGYLDEAVRISSLFIPEGTIVSTKRGSGEEKVYEATGRSIPRDVPVVVLVDRDSASASEIVAGAIQDRDRGKVVGTRTFGKGVFQQIEELSNGGALDITVGEYFTPSGRNLGGGGPKRGAGIAPDVRARDVRKTPKRDEALDKAVSTISSGAS